MGRLRHILIILMVAAHLACDGVPGFLSGSDTPFLLKAAVYSFFHASWWHLIVNMIAVWTAFRPNARRDNGKVLLLGLIIAIAVYPLALRPVIGFSNVIYAAIGLRTPPLSSPWWRHPAVVIFLIVTVAMLFIPAFSAATHIAAFIIGTGFASCRRFISYMTRDVRRLIR